MNTTEKALISIVENLTGLRESEEQHYSTAHEDRIFMWGMLKASQDIGAISEDMVKALDSLITTVLVD